MSLLYVSLRVLRLKRLNGLSTFSRDRAGKFQLPSFPISHPLRVLYNLISEPGKGVGAKTTKAEDDVRIPQSQNTENTHGL